MKSIIVIVIAIVTLSTSLITCNGEPYYVSGSDYESEESRTHHHHHHHHNHDWKDRHARDYDYSILNAKSRAYDDYFRKSLSNEEYDDVQINDTDIENIVIDEHGPFAKLGGAIVNIWNYPHQAVVFYRGHVMCSGSIISSEWILTAAFCVWEKVGASEIFIRVGSNYIHRGGKVYRISKYHTHPNWNWKRGIYDICLMRTTKPIKYNKCTQPIKLSPDMPTPNTKVGVTGWGIHGDHKVYSILLRAALQLKTLTEARCRAIYPTIFSPDMICASNLRRGDCLIDPGSALFDINKRVVVGVVSGGNLCENFGYVHVYTAMFAVRKWIFNIVGFKL